MHRFDDGLEVGRN